MNFVLRKVTGIVAASPVVMLQERLPGGEAKSMICNCSESNRIYERVRNLVALSGSFFDSPDLQERNKVALIMTVSSPIAIASSSVVHGLPVNSPVGLDSSLGATNGQKLLSIAKEIRISSRLTT